MRLYGAIDLHSNNNVIVLLNEHDEVLYEKRLPNQLQMVLRELEVYRDCLEAIAVESTFNWYWLVDGLKEAGYDIRLVNTAEVKKYEGLKYSDDTHDARWLAHLLRLGILPEGYIYPKETRALRDLLRKRAQLVRQKTTHILSIQNLMQRNTGQSISCNEINKLESEEIERMFKDPRLMMALRSNFRMKNYLGEEIKLLESTILKEGRLREEFKLLMSVSGIGKILALTIMLEVGDIRRFGKVGRYASYARCVDSKRMSNGKQKGKGNQKNGNKYLSWAYVEAANFAIRYNAKIKSYYQKKRSKTKNVIAIKAVAHKLARATYHLLKNGGQFDVDCAFA